MVSAIKMPSKKTVGSSSTAQQQHPQAARPPSPILIAEGVDPVSVLAGVVEKKARNLEKRKGRLTAMKEEGKELTKDQLQAIDKLPEVSTQLDIVRELQKQFQQLQAEIDKQKKKKDKLDKQQQKAAEREASRAQLKYSFRVQHMLGNLGEHAKECLRQGTSAGSVVLTEAQLTNIDDLYHLLNPTRAGNPRYEKELDEATEHLMLLYEGSNKEVANTTYQSLHDVLESIEASGILDEQQQQDEDEEDEEQDEDDDEGEEDVPPPAAAVVEENSEDVDEPAAVPSTIPDQLPPVSGVSPQPQQEYTQPIASVTNRPPEFAGFATENLQPMSQSFVFMHDSAIEHSNPSAPVVVGDERTALSPVENGHPEQERVQHKQQADGKDRGHSGGNKYYGNSGGGYSGGRGNRGGRGRGGYHQQRDGYQRDNGGGRGGWSGAGGGRYGSSSGNSYGAKRGGRSNYRNAGYTQSRGGNPKQ